MDFDITQEQRLLQDSVAKFAQEHCDLDKVRTFAKSPNFDADVWEQAVQLGLPLMLIPQDQDGLGMSILDAVVVQQELGRGVAPVPLLPHLLASVGLTRAQQCDERLQQLAQGQVRYGVALSHAVERRDGASVEYKKGKLSGLSLFAMGTEGAQQLLLADNESRLYAIDAADAEIINLDSIDTSRIFAEVRLDGVKAKVLDDSPAAVDAMLLTARVLLAADTLGAAQHMLRVAVDYALEREQFGRAIGSFQAVKHLCAEMVAQLEPAQSLLWYAAYTADQASDEAYLMSCHTKAYLGEVGRFVARTATEVHGGMGFTDLLGLHYWFKRIGVNRQLLGGPETLRELAARAQGWVA